MRIETILLLIIIIMTNISVTEAKIEEGVYEANFGGRQLFLQAIREAEGPIILGSYKLDKYGYLSTDLRIALRELSFHNKNCFIILEDRLTQEEKKTSVLKDKNDPLDSFKPTSCKLIIDIPIYSNIHFKTIVSSNLAVISTTNYADSVRNNRIKRDFTLFIRDKKLIVELRDALNGLIKGKKINPNYTYNVRDLQAEETKLSWGPFQHKNHIIELIETAKNEILIYQQDMQDIDVVNILLQRLKHNVKVKIIMSEYPFGKDKGNKNINNLELLIKHGAQVMLTGSEGSILDIHAKILISDGESMYLGSANFYPNVLNSSGNNLNLGVITKKKSFIKPVKYRFAADWKAYKLK